MFRSLTLALLMAVPALVIADDKKPETKPDKGDKTEKPEAKGDKTGTTPAKGEKGDKAAKFDAAKLLGDWKLSEGTKAGEKSGSDLTKDVVTITKDKMSLKAGGMDFEFSYKIDDSKDPVAIDMEITLPEGLKGSKAPGIIKADGDKFTLCYSPMSGTRPTKFESTKDNGFFLFVHTKAAKGDKPDVKPTDKPADKPKEKAPEKKADKSEK